MVTVVIQTDHSKSVHNRCVIDAIGGVCVLSRCVLDGSVCSNFLLIGPSQITFFFPTNHEYLQYQKYFNIV